MEATDGASMDGNTGTVTDQLQYIKDELKEVRIKIRELPDVEIITCVPELVQFRIRITDKKQVTLCIRFPDEYPTKALILEMKSKKFTDKILKSLCDLCDDALRSKTSQKQVFYVTEFLRNFLAENCLIACSEEISNIKKELIGMEDEIKLKQKSAQILFHIRSGQYYCRFRIAVLPNYPETQAEVTITDHNFPELLYKNFQAQAIEIARSCTQPPLKTKPKDPPFVPQPSLLPICKFLIRDSIKFYPMQRCPLCKNHVLPDDPEECKRDASKTLVRVYCGHCFHYGCLDDYMKTPPFTGGKLCPDCGKRIYHDEWQMSPEVAETRWAHKQARERELEEVVDFLQ